MKFYLYADSRFKEEVENISKQILKRRDDVFLEFLVQGHNFEQTSIQKLREYDYYIMLAEEEELPLRTPKLISALDCLERYGKPKVYVVCKLKKNSNFRTFPFVNFRNNFDEILVEIDKMNPNKILSPDFHKGMQKRD